MTVLALPDKALMSAVQSLPDNSLSANRMAALTRFLEHGFPTTRLEDWKYTDLATVVDISRRWLEGGAPTSAAEIVAGRVAAVQSSIDADWIVIANGRMAGESPASNIRGIEISTLSELSLLPAFDVPLADLNAALLADGVQVTVGAEACQERPLGLLIIDGTDKDPGVQQTRIRIRLEEGARAQFLEYHASVGDADHYANSIVELTLAKHAAADYVRVQNRRLNHTQTQRTTAQLAANSTLRLSGFDLGGRLVRHDVDIDISGKESEVSVGGLYVAGDGQHIDSHVRVDHHTGPARSSQEYRGILDGGCRCVWNGKTIVHAGSDGTDAEQANHNLLLSEGAEIDAKPELEIYADEVKCSHGTTVGQLDEAALFYLRSRGLDKQEATRALTRAFGASIVSHSPIPALTQLLTDMIEQRLADLSEGRTE